MAWNGIGTYVLNPSYSPEANGAVIDATRYNGLTLDIANGITQALNKNGENAATGNISWGGFKITNHGAPAATGDVLAWGNAASITALTVTLDTSMAGVLAIGGTATYPATRLSVKISTEGTGISAPNGFAVARTATDSLFFIGYNTTPDAWVLSGTYSSTGAYKPIVLATSDLERVRIDTAGALGIGTVGDVIDGQLNVRKDAGGGPKLILTNREVNGSVHKYGSLLFAGYRDVALPCWGAGIWAEGASAAGNTFDLVFGAMSNNALSTYPTERLRINTGGDIIGLGVAAVRVKTAATSRISTTTLADDPHLIVPLAVGVWSVRLWAPVAIATSGGSNGWKIAFPFTGTASGDIGTVSSPDILLSTMQTFTLNSGTALAAASTTPTGWMIVDGSLTVTAAGNLKFQWAQNSSGAQNLTFGQGATLICTKVG